MIWNKQFYEQRYEFTERFVLNPKFEIKNPTSTTVHLSCQFELFMELNVLLTIIQTFYS
jgi:hypothetical protein